MVTFQDREIIRNEIKYLLLIAVNADAKERTAIRSLIIKFLEVIAEG